MVAFGWSVGDIAKAISVVTKLIQALDNAKGAAKEYRDSLDFLSGVNTVLFALQPLAQSNAPVSAEPEAEESFSANVRVLQRECNELAAYLQKQKPNKALDKCKWAIHDLADINSRLGKMKRAVMESMMTLHALITVDVYRETLSVAEDTAQLRESASRQETMLDRVSSVLEDVNGHTELLLYAAGNCKTELAQTRKEDIEPRARIEQQLSSVQLSQSELTMGMQQLTAYIVEQAKNGESEKVREQWTSLQVEVTERAANLEDLERVTEGVLNVLDFGTDVADSIRRMLPKNPVFDAVIIKIQESSVVARKFQSKIPLLNRLHPSAARRDPPSLSPDPCRPRGAIAAPATNTAKSLAGDGTLIKPPSPFKMPDAISGTWTRLSSISGKNKSAAPEPLPPISGSPARDDGNGGERRINRLPSESEIATHRPLIPAKRPRHSLSTPAPPHYRTTSSPPIVIAPDQRHASPRAHPPLAAGATMTVTSPSGTFRLASSGASTMTMASPSLVRTASPGSCTNSTSHFPRTMRTPSPNPATERQSALVSSAEKGAEEDDEDAPPLTVQERRQRWERG